MTTCARPDCTTTAAVFTTDEALCKPHHAADKTRPHPTDKAVRRPSGRRRARPGEALAWLHEAVATATPEDCQLWPFNQTRTGYGQIWFDGRMAMPHRVVFTLTGRTPPQKPLQARHLCGNRLCANYFHIVAGTNSENQMDRAGHNTSNRGERQWQHKLTADNVRFIRSSSESGRALARRFGVAPSTISMVRTGANWAHLDQPGRMNALGALLASTMPDEFDRDDCEHAC